MFANAYTLKQIYAVMDKYPEHYNDIIIMRHSLILDEKDQDGC